MRFELGDVWVQIKREGAGIWVKEAGIVLLILACGLLLFTKIVS